MPVEVRSVVESRRAARLIWQQRFLNWRGELAGRRGWKPGGCWILALNRGQRRLLRHYRLIWRLPEGLWRWALPRTRNFHCL